ncbi:hypothetical protein [Desulfovibrio sp. JC022]|uniref:hypothetical protein n=1 Tax=Desulfovibrio sp. JC022 TaxID=2593642 RepID=UPI0013D502E3|nr:hypothetical protein [Desulfovibrio sp. JC022]NDV23565.1 hypothetical protein [Desulfovibrio sp. JC022]
MNDIALATPVEGGVQDTSLQPWLPTERPDTVPDGIDGPTLNLHEHEQQKAVDNAIHSLTGKGNLIDRIV